MRKNRKRILVIISSLLASIVLLIIIVANHMLYKVRSDWERIFKEQKYFFKQYFFSGIIIERNYMGKKAEKPYNITIKLDSSTVLPSFGYLLYYDFYFFDSEQEILTIAVPEYIYKNTVINDSILHNIGSDSLIVNKQPYLFLSIEQLEWVPK